MVSKKKSWNFGDKFDIFSEAGRKIGELIYVDDDPIRLGANVVRVDCERLDGGGKFYAYVHLLAGEALGTWKKNGRRSSESHSSVLWCSVPPTDLRKAQSINWKVWETKGSQRKPESAEELLRAEIGFVISPQQIVHRIVNGNYSFPMPKREFL